MLSTPEVQSITSVAAASADLNLPIEDQVEVDSCEFTLTGDPIYRAWVSSQLIGKFYQYSERTWFITPTALCDRRPFGSAELALAAIVNIWKHSRHHNAEVEKSEIGLRTTRRVIATQSL